MSNDNIYYPEKGWKDRTAPIMYVPGLPQEFVSDFLEIKRRFGIDIANIIIFTYRKHGPRVTSLLIKRMKRFDSFDELLEFLESKISMFDAESRKILNAKITEIKIMYYFKKLLNELDERKCQGTERETIIQVFHELVKRGIFYSPDCIINVVEAKLHNKSIKTGCKQVYKTINELGII